MKVIREGSRVMVNYGNWRGHVGEVVRLAPDGTWEEVQDGEQRKFSYKQWKVLINGRERNVADYALALFDHRMPPKPPWMIGGGEVPKGCCTWCREPILAGQRKNPTRCSWHLECLAEYMLIYDWSTTRNLAFERAHGHCDGCGALLASECFLKGDLRHQQSRAFFVDHVHPLVDWPEIERPFAQDITLEDFVFDVLERWLLTNLQVLCDDCNNTKTGEENSRRAVKRRREKTELLPMMRLLG